MNFDVNRIIQFVANLPTSTKVLSAIALLFLIFGFIPLTVICGLIAFILFKRAQLNGTSETAPSLRDESSKLAADIEAWNTLVALENVEKKNAITAENDQFYGELDAESFTARLFARGLIRKPTNEESLSLLKVTSLRELLKSMKLKRIGNKSQLIERIAASLDDSTSQAIQNRDYRLFITPLGQQYISTYKDSITYPQPTLSQMAVNSNSAVQSKVPGKLGKRNPLFFAGIALLGVVGLFFTTAVVSGIGDASKPLAFTVDSQNITIEGEDGAYLLTGDLSASQADLTINGRTVEPTIKGGKYTLEGFVQDLGTRQPERTITLKAKKGDQEISHSIKLIDNYEKAQIEKRQQEEQAKRQAEEQARLEAERKQQEELARQEAERVQQEELARQAEEERLQQEAALAQEQEAAQAASAPAISSGGSYIGNVNSDIFHRSSCHTLPKEKNRVYFSSRDEAMARGYRPCQNCYP